MGVVYEARHEQIGQRAAVKVLMRDLARDPRILQRFLDEARTMTLVQHEGIVKVFDYGQLSDGVPYILMEFLEGMSLQERLKGSSEQSVGLPLPNAIEIARQVAGALAALHQKNIIHRDGKPARLPSRNQKGTGWGKRREKREDASVAMPGMWLEGMSVCA